jgi:hypothetical protein
MGLLQLLPLALILVCAFWIVAAAKAPEPKLSNAKVVGLWILSIVVPLVFMSLAFFVFIPNDMAVTHFEWALIDTLGMRLGEAQYLAEVFWRTVGAGAGILVMRGFVAKLRPRPKSVVSN